MVKIGEGGRETRNVYPPLPRSSHWPAKKFRRCLSFCSGIGGYAWSQVPSGVWVGMSRGIRGGAGTLQGAPGWVYQRGRFIRGWELVHQQGVGIPEGWGRGGCTETSWRRPQHVRLASGHLNLLCCLVLLCLTWVQGRMTSCSKDRPQKNLRLALRKPLDLDYSLKDPRFDYSQNDLTQILVSRNLFSMADLNAVSSDSGNAVATNLANWPFWRLWLTFLKLTKLFYLYFNNLCT